MCNQQDTDWLIKYATESQEALLCEVIKDRNRLFSRGKKYQSTLLVVRHDIAALVRKVIDLEEANKCSVKQS